MAMANGSAGDRPHAVATIQGSPIAPATLLGRAAVRIPIGGRIRAGIKVLTKRAAESADAKAIYTAGVATGKSFDTIGRELAEKLPDLKNPLTPKNVPFFTVRGEDFPNPEVARQIMDLYAEDRGDGVKRLYRFPVVFPADAWQNVMPHEMAMYASSERVFWSEYADDGQTRYCKTYEAVPVDRGGRRAIRVFGGRKTVLRRENGGLCDPERCPEYQARKCNLSGRFIFFIPGIRSISAFDLPTNSFYAMQAAIEKFQTIGFMRGGRISGFLDGQRTPFYITKRLVEVARIDEEGRAVRVPQWLIELEAPIDVTALLRADDGLEAVEMRAGEAASRLGGSAKAGPAGNCDDDRVLDVEERSNAPVPPGTRAASTSVANLVATSSLSGAGGGAPESASLPPDPERSDSLMRTRKAPAVRRREDGEGAESADLAWIFDAAKALGIDHERYDTYANKRWGKGWKLTASGRKRALDEVTDFEGDARSFQEKVRGEVDIFT